MDQKMLQILLLPVNNNDDFIHLSNNHAAWKLLQIYF
jgi:hypothetical protein